jgi:Domain of unknown function (DUF4263)
MPQLVPYSFGKTQRDLSLDALRDFLEPKDKWLKESDDITPFFRKHPHLAASLGVLYSGFAMPTHIGFEVDLWGHLKPDITVVNEDKGVAIFVELEDAQKASVFESSDTRHYRKWGSRIEKGHSQLIDWSFCLEEHKVTAAKELKVKKLEHWEWLLVVGRSHGLQRYEIDRIDWRSNKVKIHDKTALIITYDTLHETLVRRLSEYRIMS